MANKEQYQLTAAERNTLQALHSAVAEKKLRVYELNVQLEAAQKERDATVALFQGALAMLANGHEMPGATLNPEFTILTAKENQ